MKVFGRPHARLRAHTTLPPQSAFVRFRRQSVRLCSNLAAPRSLSRDDLQMLALNFAAAGTSPPVDLSLDSTLAGIEAMLIQTGRDDRPPRIGVVRLGRGRYIPADLWNTLSPEQRHLAQMLAFGSRTAHGPVFSHISAAVLFGLPLRDASVQPVHVTAASNGASRRRAGLVRHRAALGPGDVVTVGGLLCTAPDRTILDIARFMAPETAIACADAYLRARFRVGRHIDEEFLGRWREDMKMRIRRHCGERGIARARDLLKVSDPRTDSVLESVSHLYLRRFGFEIELQVPVVIPGGQTYYADFEFRGLDRFGECDGKLKYVDSRLRGGESAEEVVYREKRRRDLIEGVTNKRIVRWGWREISSEGAFARMLDGFGIGIPRPPSGCRRARTRRG